MNRLIITSGDILGIGPQVAVEAVNTLAQIEKKRIIFICERSVVEFLRKKALSLDPSVELIDTGVVENFSANIDIEQGARSALKAIELACELIKGDKSLGILTGPVNKERIAGLGVEFSGHTEFLQRYFNAAWVEMLFASDLLTVLLATRHIPLKDVAFSLSKDRIVHLLRIFNGYLSKFKGNPQIAVCGINPHAGEGGLLGSEEQEIIIPAIGEASENGINAIGPFAADTLFWEENRKRFDGILAMYHDQGLIPIKAMAFRSAVNITLGLPFVRTSPCHGTAYPMAYKGKADYMPMLSAIKKAFELLDYAA